MADAQLRFGHDMQLVYAEQVIILVHRPSECVFDRDDAAGCVARFDGAEQVHERRARHELERRPMRLERGGMTERSRLALDGDRPPTVFTHR